MNLNMAIALHLFLKHIWGLFIYTLLKMTNNERAIHGTGPRSV